MNEDETTTYLAIGTILLIILATPVAVYFAERTVCRYSEEPFLVTDILQVSAGGLGRMDMCVLMTDKGKRSFQGWRACSAQVNETIISKTSNGFCFLTHTYEVNHE